MFRIDQRPSRRSGFTVVEILITVAVIGLLLALILPAMMSARGAARRLDCQNRLRQFGVALSHFETTYRHLPYDYHFPGGVAGSTEQVPPQLRILPYLEQTDAMERIKRRMRYADEMRLPVFHCPDETVQVGLNYTACVGMGLECHEIGTRGSREIGVFVIRDSRTPLRLSDIADGLSNTASMSERTISLGPGNSFQRDRDIWYSGIDALTGTETRNVDDAVAVCRSLNYQPATSFHPFAGRKLKYSGMVSCRYNHAATPNVNFSDCSMHALNRHPDEAEMITDCGIVVTARSHHTDRSVNLLLMDGSVRAISPYVDLKVWRSTATRAGEDRGL